MMAAPSTLKEVIQVIVDLIGALVPIIGGFAVLIFVWGLAKFIWNAGDTKTHEEGKSLMIWGLIILFVMVSLMGIIRFFYEDAGFGQTLGFPLIGR
jgi:hypothetical protein